MASELPPGVDSSYSDPIFDRLEIVNSWLARNWKLVVVAVVVVIAAALFIRSQGQHTPLADDARQLFTADRDSAINNPQPLLAVLNDSSIDAIIRAEAGLRAAALQQEDGKHSEAYATLLKASEAAPNDDALQISIQLSQGALAEDQQQFDAAIQAYQQAQTRIATTPNTSGLNFVAGLGIARANLAKASTAEADEAATLRAAAVTALESLSSNTEAGTEAFQRMVALKLARLEATQAASPPVEAEPTAEAAPADAPNEAAAGPSDE
jgi:tetratricopeptide (TPR) repeat protein